MQTKIFSASGCDDIEGKQPLDKSIKSNLFFIIIWGHTADPCLSHMQKEADRLGKDSNTCHAFFSPKLIYWHARHCFSPSHLSSNLIWHFAWLMGVLHTSASAQGTSRKVFPQHHKAGSAGVMATLFPFGRIEYSCIISALYFSESRTNWPLIFKLDFFLKLS